jgi:hypothetical protein
MDETSKDMTIFRVKISISVMLDALSQRYVHIFGKVTRP